MEKFNTKRFANVLKWDFMNNWKYTLWLFLVMIVVFTCMLGLTYFNSNSDYMQGVHDTMMSVQASACNFILSIIILAGASRMFLPLKDKQSATAFLSLPATNLEKFISRFLNVIVLWIVVGCVAFLCADALQMLLAKLLGANHVVSGSKTFFSMWPFDNMEWRGEHYWLKIQIGVILTTLMTYATYILGGILFRRRQFWITSVAIFAVSVIGIIAIVNIGWAIGEWLEAHNEQLEALMERFFKDKDTFINFLFYAWWTISGLITVFFTWLTYRFFKRAQVINNKFLNV
jgi:hypothetical protein